MGAVSVPPNSNYIHLLPQNAPPATPKPTTRITAQSAGLNDVTVDGGGYNQIVKATFAVTINTDSTFDWERTGGSGDDSDTDVAITGSAQSLGDGVQVTFDEVEGYTPGDEIVFETMPSNSMYWDGTADPVALKAVWSNGDVTSVGGSSGVTSLALDTNGTEPALSGSTGAVTLSIPPANGSKTGVVTTTTQYFSGNKIFTGSIGNNAGISSNSGTVTSINSYGATFDPLVTLTPAATITINAETGNAFGITPDQDIALSIDHISGNSAQSIILFVYTSGVTPYTITFSTGFRATASLVTGVDTGKVFTLNFKTDGTNAIELSRTVAIT